MRACDLLHYHDPWEWQCLFPGSMSTENAVVLTPVGLLEQDRAFMLKHRDKWEQRRRITSLSPLSILPLMKYLSLNKIDIWEILLQIPILYYNLLMTSYNLYSIDSWPMSIVDKSPLRTFLPHSSHNKNLVLFIGPRYTWGPIYGSESL